MPPPKSGQSPNTQTKLPIYAVSQGKGKEKIPESASYFGMARR
jgi:hypothetical protein